MKLVSNLINFWKELEQEKGNTKHIVWGKIRIKFFCEKEISTKS